MFTVQFAKIGGMRRLIHTILPLIYIKSNSCVENYPAVMSLCQENYTPYPFALTYTQKASCSIILHTIAHLFYLKFVLNSASASASEHICKLSTRLSSCAQFRKSILM